MSQEKGEMCAASSFIYSDSDTLSGRFHILNELRQTEKLCDAVFTCQGEKFPVHRAVLAACSPYFKAMFTIGMQESEKTNLEIPDVQPHILRKLIDYAYTFELEITENDLDDLLIVGDRFSIPGVVSNVSEKIISKLTPENCFKWKEFALHYQFTYLSKAIKSFIYRNFDEIAATRNSDISKLDLKEFIDYISSDHTNVKNEELIFETVVGWIESDEENRLKHISELLGCVRLGLLPTEYFLENVVQHKYISQKTEIEPLLSSAWDLLYELDRTNSKEVDLRNPLVRPRVPNAVMFAVGGWSGGNPITFFESYDTRADRWYTHAFVEDNTPRAYHGLAALNGVVYIIGGFDGMSYFNSVRSFNPKTKEWKEVAPMYYQRCYISVATMDGYIYACGGYDGRWRQRSAERYDPEANQWTLLPQMNCPRSDASCDSLFGKLYICGGFNGEECMNSAEVFDPRTNQWTMISPMEKRRSGVSVVAYQGSIFALGGFNGVRRQACGEKWDPSSRRWCAVRNMYTPRSNFATAVMDGMIFAVGGFNGSTTIPHVECYEGDSGEWFDATDMNINRSALSACIIEDLENIKDFTFHGNTPNVCENENGKVYPNIPAEGASTTGFNNLNHLVSMQSTVSTTSA